MTSTLEPVSDTTEGPGLLAGRYRLPTVALVTLVTLLVLNESDPGEQGANSAALQISDTLGSSLSVGIAGALVTGFPQLSAGLRAAGALTAFFAMACIAAAFRVEHSK